MKGSCLCKAVVYEVDKFDKPLSHCHCYTCRKANAAAFNTSGVALRDDFRWLSGEEKLSSYESSPGKLRYFCSVCGSQLVAEKPAQPYMIVRVATLDDDPGIFPQRAIWTSHKVPWLDYEHIDESWPEWPATY
jgi:ADP-ribosyl-[dinitrogen reductase] hydrolase